MTYLISRKTTRIIISAASLICIPLLLWNVHPIVTSIIVLFYCFFIPAVYINGLLQRRFVGLGIYKMSPFFTPAVLPLLILVSMPFWLLTYEFRNPILNWVSILIIIIIVLDVIYIFRTSRLIRVTITGNQVVNFTLFLVCFISGILIALIF